MPENQFHKYLCVNQYSANVYTKPIINAVIPLRRNPKFAKNTPATPQMVMCRATGPHPGQPHPAIQAKNSSQNSVKRPARTPNSRPASARTDILAAAEEVSAAMCVSV